MTEQIFRDQLASLDSVAPSRGSEDRARERMLAAFDGVAVLDPDQDHPVIGAAELSVVAHARPRSSRGPILGMLAAAAAVVALVLVSVSLLGNEPQDTDVVDEVVDASGPVQGAATGPGDSNAEQGTSPNLDDDLPRLVEGLFESDQLGTKLSLVTDRPLWLIRHQPGLIEFVTELEGQPARLVISVPTSATQSVDEAGNLESFLRNAESVRGGQLSTLDIDEVASTYWRGGPTLTDEPECEPGTPCVVLYERPVPIGIEAISGLTDIAERPSDTGLAVLIIASLPFEGFTLTPFGEFAQVVETITFEQLGAGLVTH